VKPLDDYDFRPITFEGITFPPSLMGISILEPVLDIDDEDLGDWIWRLPLCCGTRKEAAADRCARCARRIVDLMLEQRQRVLDGIRDRLGPNGFDPENTFRDWLLALQSIAELSEAAEGKCVWSAPVHPRDHKMSHGDVLKWLDNLRKGSEG
jgi:hypothetical protein